MGGFELPLHQSQINGLCYAFHVHSFYVCKYEGVYLVPSDVNIITAGLLNYCYGAMMFFFSFVRPGRQDIVGI